MPTADRKLRVFLCHASQDKPIVRELYQKLLAEGWIDPWLDEKKLLPGQDWDLEIEKAVEAADAVIVCLSNNSVTKEGYVQKEIKNIIDKSDEKPEGAIFIIPVRLDDCEIPHRIKKRQYVDYFPAGNRKIAYIRMLRSLKVRLFMILRSSVALNKKYTFNNSDFSSRQPRNNNLPKNNDREKTLSLSGLPEIKTGLKLGIVGFICALFLQIFAEEIIYTANYFLLLNGFLFGLATSFFSLRFEKPVSRGECIIVGIISSTICGVIISVAYGVIFTSLDQLGVLYMRSANNIYNILGFFSAIAGGVIGSYLYTAGKNFQ
jgi:hypothetical protein